MERNPEKQNPKLLVAFVLVVLCAIVVFLFRSSQTEDEYAPDGLMKAVPAKTAPQWKWTPREHSGLTPETAARGQSADSPENIGSAERENRRGNESQGGPVAVDSNQNIETGRDQTGGNIDPGSPEPDEENDGLDEDESDDEGRVIFNIKLGFIYNFARFTTWPENAFENENSPIVLCISRRDPKLSTSGIERTEIDGRKFEVVYREDIDDLKGIHIFYHNSDDIVLAENILGTLENRPVLTVGETEGFAGMGGMLNFFIEGNRLDYEINTAASDRAGLEFETRIIETGKHVEEYNRT